MTNKLVAVTTIGFMCLGMIALLNSIGDLGWASAGGPLAQALGFALGCMVLSVCTVLCFFYGRTIDTFRFAGAATFALTVHNIGGKDTPLTAGWFFLLWTVFFFYIWLSSFKSGWARSLNFLATWLATLGFCLLYWTHVEFFGVMNGWAGLVVGLSALYISAAEVLNHTWGKPLLPTGMRE